MPSFLICDDHGMLRDALAMAIAAHWPGAPLWLASDYPEAFAQAAHRPNVILLDLAMPGGEPRTGVQRLLAIAPDSRVLVVTGSDDDSLFLDLLAFNVRGIVPKTAGVGALIAAIERVLTGDRYLQPRGSTNDPADSASGSPPPEIQLTDRQHTVLRLLSQGRSNKEIARALNISPATVKVHIGQLMTVLGAVNRTDAAIKATARSLI